jgi:hypothetical protein
MLVSVHIADVGPRRALAIVTKRQAQIAAPGLRHANLALGARLGGNLLTKPNPGRVALVAMWDDDAALDRFLADSPLAAAFKDGWHTRLQPLRAHGSWPGLPDDISKARVAQDTEPVAVLTMGRVKFPRLIPFLRASGKAEQRLVGAPGLIWATALVRPPFVATCSFWESADASVAYAYADGTHNAAIAAGRTKPFHHQEAFVRFRPYAMSGHLEGRNPLHDARATTQA